MHSTTNRLSITRRPWEFVSDKAKLQDLIVYYTSGTTGPPMDVLFDPIAQASWLPQMESVLSAYDISLTNDSKRVAIALISSQKSTITYASLSSYLNGAGILKINLNDNDWNSVEDRKSYIEKYDPEILTGDPVSFLALKELKLNIHPRAMISSAMKLNHGTKKELESYFCCPVIDVYSLTECRNIAVAEGNRYKSIRPDLYLEIFTPDEDRLITDGARGEIVVTGGNNPFLPLIRYRTGDYGSLVVEDGIQYIENLEARKPVLLYRKDGQIINSIDISRAFVHLLLVGFKLHQEKNHSIECKCWSNKNCKSEIETILFDLFGPVKIQVQIKPISDIPNGGKLIQFSSNF